MPLTAGEVVFAIDEDHIESVPDATALTRMGFTSTITELNYTDGDHGDGPKPFSDSGRGGGTYHSRCGPGDSDRQRSNGNDLHIASVGQRQNSHVVERFRNNRNGPFGAGCGFPLPVHPDRCGASHILAIFDNGK
jgi:hypothetical protein